MSTQHSGVSGLVLSVGEKTTADAIESLRHQTFPCVEVIRVDNVVPFHRAMQRGVAWIRTPFFIQCDADMKLDPDCVQVMMDHVRDDVAVTAGYLSDELLGVVQAVRLFRTEAVKQTHGHDSDTDLVRRLVDKGWKSVFVRRTSPVEGRPEDVLGDHRPEYTAHYTFEKFRLAGHRLRLRGASREFATCLDRLRASSHPMARIALIALCRGLFDDPREGHREPRGGFSTLQRFLDGGDCPVEDFHITRETESDTHTVNGRTGR